MKRTNEDIKQKVLNEMCINGTLSHIHNGFEVPPLIGEDEVRAALLSRLSSELNEELKEPYGRARVNDVPTDGIIADAVDRFNNLLTEICSQLFIAPPNEEDTKKQFTENLDHRFTGV